MREKIIILKTTSVKLCLLTWYFKYLISKDWCESKFYFVSYSFYSRYFFVSSLFWIEIFCFLVERQASTSLAHHRGWKCRRFWIDKTLKLWQGVDDKGIKICAAKRKLKLMRERNSRRFFTFFLLSLSLHVNRRAAHNFKYPPTIRENKEINIR